MTTDEVHPEPQKRGRRKRKFLLATAALVTTGAVVAGIVVAQTRDRNRQASSLTKVANVSHVASAKPGVGLVLFSATPDGEQRELREDLATMAHLLGKAVPGPGRYLRESLGVHFMVDPNSQKASRPEVHYIEGVGAVFKLTTNMPLLPPENTAEAEANPAPKTSAWEKAKREMSGTGNRLGSHDAAVHQYYNGALTTVLGAQAGRMSYNADTVEGMKTSLREALREAANIRHLAPNDSVIVRVLAPDQVKVTTVTTGTLNPGENRGITTLVNPNRTANYYVAGTNSPSGSGTRTVMNLRVDRSTVEAFASGELSAEAFDSAVQVFLYRELF